MKRQNSLFVLFTVTIILCAFIVAPIFVLSIVQYNMNATKKTLSTANNVQKSYIYEIADNNNLTRRQAVINFIAGLQMEDGGFVYTLTSPEEEEGIFKQSYEAIRALSLLNGVRAINRDKLVEFISRRQMEDGGFVSSLDYSHEKPDIVSTYAAVYILSKLNALDLLNKTALLNWLMECYSPDEGSFTSAPKSEYSSYYVPFADTMYTAAGVLTLYLLNEEKLIDTSKVINYFMSCYQSDGGFSMGPNDNFSFGVHTVWSLMALQKLNALNRIDREKTINYGLHDYNSTTQFFDTRDTEFIVTTYYRIRVLSILNAVDRVNKTRIAEEILKYQSNMHGGFLISRNETSKVYYESLETTWMAIESLAGLNALDALNESFSVLYNPAWFGRPYIPHHEDTTSFEYNLALEFFNAQIQSIIVLGISLIILSVLWLSIRLYIRYIEPKIQKKRN